MGRSVQVWRLSDLVLLHTVLLPPGPRGDEHLHPAEVRVLGDGKSVMVTTFRCGMYVLSELDGIPVATLARSFPWSAVAGEDTDCNVPVRFGRFWVQPVGTTGSLVVLDVSRPENAGDRGRTRFRRRCPPTLARARTRRKAHRDDRRRNAGRWRLPDRHGSRDRKAPARDAIFQPPGPGFPESGLTVMSGPMARPVRLSRMELCLVP